MSHCCILVDGKLFYWRYIKLTILMILSIYLECLRNKGMSITLETIKPLYSTNATLQRMGYIVLKMKGRECGISQICLLEVRVVPSSSKIF